MPTYASLRSLALVAVAAAGILLASAGLPVLGTTAAAAPPAHAPAHGWRKKNDPSYAGYTGQNWERDYGVRSGRCNTDEVLTAVGAVAGGVIGNRAASEGNRTIATIVGAVIGGAIGNTVGNAIDGRDRACIGHTLELANVGRTVAWTNPDTGVGYAVKPLRDLGKGCREFELRADRSGKKRKDVLRACRADDGAWTFRDA